MFRPLGLHAAFPASRVCSKLYTCTESSEKTGGRSPSNRLLLGERPGEDNGYPPYIYAKYKFRWAPPLLPRVLGIHFINKPYPTLLKDLNPPLKSLPSKKASKLISTQQLKITLIWTGSKKVHVRHFVRYLNTLMSENGDMMANSQ